MKRLEDVLVCKNKSQVNEGLVRNLISLVELKTIDESSFINGILNMYEYIVNEEDIKMFFAEYPLKQRTMWKNIYKLYENKVWSIIDVSNNSYGNNYNKGRGGRKNFSKENLEEYLGIEENVITKISPSLRRLLRELINDSRNKKLELKASDVDDVILLSDPLFEGTSYLITFNRTKGLFGKLFRAADINFLKKAFEKAGIEAAEHEESADEENDWGDDEQ